jgi:transposase-like protein
VPALSRLSNAAHVIGADLNQLTDVVFKLEQRMGENSEAFQRGLSAMGLSTEQLKAAGPDKYLELVTAGLQRIADPSARAAAGTEVLGKGYRDVAHALNDLDDGLRRTADIEPWTAQQAKDAEAFGFQVNALKEHVSALGIALGADLIPALSLFVGWIDKLRVAYTALPDAVKAVISPANLVATAFRNGAAALEAFGLKATELPPLETLIAQTTAAHDATVQQLAPHVRTASEALEAQKEVLKAHEDQVKKDAAALAEWQKATDALNASTVGWQTTLDTLDGTVVEAIKFYLSAGVSQGDLAKAYGVTAQQVAAVKIALEDYATALTATADLEKAEADQRKVIDQAMLKATNDRILAEFQKKQAAEASEAAFLKANLADAQAQDAIQQGIQTTTAAATESADVIGAAYTTHFKAAKDSFEQFQGVVVAGTAEMIAGLTSFHDSGAYVQMQKDMRDVQNARGGFYIDTGFAPPPVQTRDSGGPVVAGQSYLIGGGKAPEIFTPGASGFVTPGGGAGGGGVVNNFYITHPLGTPDAIARAVGDAQVALLKGQGMRLPYGT